MKEFINFKNVLTSDIGVLMMFKFYTDEEPTIQEMLKTYEIMIPVSPIKEKLIKLESDISFLKFLFIDE